MALEDQAAVREARSGLSVERTMTRGDRLDHALKPSGEFLHLHYLRMNLYFALCPLIERGLWRPQGLSWYEP